MAVDPIDLKIGDKILHGITTLGVRNKSNSLVYFDDNTVAAYSVDGEQSEFWFKCFLTGDVGVAGHPRFLALLDQLRTMHLAKSADYGTTSDVYANYRRAASLGIPPAKGILIRMADKWSRIETWANGGTLKNEGVIDSLLDLASYALGAVVMIEEEDKK